MKKRIFTGMATALITPMDEAQQVDKQALGRLIDFQLDSGINALVSMGTTGESATLEPWEQQAVIRFTVERVSGRVPVIAGVGSNSTAHAIENVKNACAAGADALLAVTPYYNKATQGGLVRHFVALADVATVPLILYNVPGRTGCNLLPKTVAELSEHPNIVAVKEASGNMAQMVQIMHLCGDRIDIYSGEDALTVPMMAMGGAGTISVLSNVVPRLAVDMTDACTAGDFAAAAALQCRLLPLIDCLFSEVNPIPARAAMAAMGYGTQTPRLPLTEMEPEKLQRMLQQMRLLGVRV